MFSILFHSFSSFSTLHISLASHIFFSQPIKTVVVLNRSLLTMHSLPMLNRLTTRVLLMTLMARSLLLLPHMVPPHTLLPLMMRSASPLVALHQVTMQMVFLSGPIMLSPLRFITRNLLLFITLRLLMFM